jgi:hypothetical protein
MLEAGASPLKFLENLRQWGLSAYEPDASLLDWSILIADAQKWENFGRERLVAACSGKSNPEIAAIVEQQCSNMECNRPYIENLVFRSDR